MKYVLSLRRTLSTKNTFIITQELLFNISEVWVNYILISYDIKDINGCRNASVRHIVDH